MTKLKYDESGKSYGRLSVLTHVGSGKFECVCECGKTVVVQGAALRSGSTRSCGCLHGEIVRNRLSHGMSKHPAYNSYMQAKKRCTNPKNSRWDRYGGRGIKFLLPSFGDFWKVFASTWFENATIGRIDNNGNYEIGNVRWETRSEQSENRSTNVHITYGGKTMLLRDWLKMLGISNHMYRNHVAKGATFAELISYYNSEDYLKRRRRGGAGSRVVTS